VANDPDEIAFDVDEPGFNDVLERAQHLGCEIRGPLEHTLSSRGFYLSDPDGRRLEFTHEDRGVYWRE
jgi:catechol-2,3-dioxygenase